MRPTDAIQYLRTIAQQPYGSTNARTSIEVLGDVLVAAQSVDKAAQTKSAALPARLRELGAVLART